jgi:branched-chain amino acid transport system substrate-binding protein
MNTKRHVLQLAIGLLATSLPASFALAADTGPIKIGLIVPMTGQAASTGRQTDAAVKLWMAQHGSTIAGRQVGSRLS